MDHRRPCETCFKMVELRDMSNCEWCKTLTCKECFKEYQGQAVCVDCYDHRMRWEGGVMEEDLGVDGLLWAREFCKLNAKKAFEPQELLDTMLGWFCNAIEAGKQSGIDSERLRIWARLSPPEGDDANVIQVYKQTLRHIIFGINIKAADEYSKKG